MALSMSARPSCDHGRAFQSAAVLLVQQHHLAPAASKRAAWPARSASSRSAANPMISGSVWNSRCSRRASRIASSHKRRARPRPVPEPARIAFVEHQVDHGRHSPRGARRAPPDPGVSNGTSALAMRALARVIRCSIAVSPTRKALAICRTPRARDDAQRQRDLLGRRQVGMAADEHQPQDVVAVVRAVQALGHRRLDVVARRRSWSSGGSSVWRLCLRTPSRPALRPTMISQAAGVARRPLLGPGFAQRPQAGVLIGLLGGVQVSEIAQQGPDRLGTGGRERRESIQARSVMPARSPSTRRPELPPPRLQQGASRAGTGAGAGSHRPRRGSRPPDRLRNAQRFLQDRRSR